MNDPKSSPTDATPASRDEMMAALFANMVVQQANMAMMMLGKVAHPETGQFIHDIEAARMFIDQLEMLEVKTKGNLGKQEEALLKQALSAVHMSFVEAVEPPAAGEAPAVEKPAAAGPAPAPQSDSAPAKAAAPETAAPEESRKKFSKKY